jgi:anti-anti-sigma factor
MAELTRVALGDQLETIEISGEFDLADEPQAQELIAASLESPARSLLLDLSACRFMDSAGIRTLIRTYDRAREAGLRFAIAGLAPQLRRVLNLSGLTDELPVFAEREAALRSLSARTT